MRTILFSLVALGLFLVSACGSTPLVAPPGSDGGPGPGLDGGAGLDGGGAVEDGGGGAPDGGTPDGGTPDGGAPDGGTPDGGTPFVLGAACAAGGCGDGFCLTEGDTGFPGGYCTTSCAQAPCPQGGICYARFNVCLQPCSGGCRPGYTCASRLGPDVLPASACVPGSEGGKIGDPCANAGPCPVGGFCLTESTPPGFPGGYCSMGCRVGTSDCGDGATCVDLDGAGSGAPLCLKTCENDGSCRLGYVCEGAWFGAPLPAKSCVPGTRADVAVGAACANAGACPPSWLCLRPEDGFPDGYCTRSCGRQGPSCPGDAFCQVNFGVCLDGCSEPSQCRQPRYTCHNRMFGAPLAQSTCVPFNAAAHIGDPCQTFSDCTLGGFCIEATNDQGEPTGFTGGYCSFPCGAAGAPACPEGSVCQSFGPNTAVCLDECAVNADCRAREGYVCRTFAPTRLACFPQGL